MTPWLRAAALGGLIALCHALPPDAAAAAPWPIADDRAQPVTDRLPRIEIGPGHLGLRWDPRDDRSHNWRDDRSRYHRDDRSQYHRDDRRDRRWDRRDDRDDDRSDRHDRRDDRRDWRADRRHDRRDEWRFDHRRFYPVFRID